MLQRRRSTVRSVRFNRMWASVGAIALVALLAAACSAKPTTIGGTNKSAATTVQPTASTTTMVVGPPGISPMMTGTAKPTIPAGTAGKAQVVVTGPFVTKGSGTEVLVVVVNELGHTVNHLDVAGPASVNGQIVGSGDSQGFAPENVQSGQAAFGYVYFSTAIPAGATLDLSVTGTKGQSTYFVDMQVLQANLVPPSNTYSPIVVTGAVKNTSAGAVHGPISADVYCFDSSGALADVGTGFTSGDSSAPLAAGATASYSIDLYGTPTCTTYLVASSAYGKL